MALKVYKFGSLEEVNLFLRGGVIGGQVGGGIYGLVGTTLTFTSPAATSVTFVAATTGGSDRDPAALIFKDIKAQLEAAIPALTLVQVRGCFAIVEAVPTSGVTVSAVSSNAKSLLGFDFDGTSVGKVHTKSGGALPSFLSLQSWEHGYTLVVEE